MMIIIIVISGGVYLSTITIYSDNIMIVFSTITIMITVGIMTNIIYIIISITPENDQSRVGFLGGR